MDDLREQNGVHHIKGKIRSDQIRSELSPESGASL